MTIRRQSLYKIPAKWTPSLSHEKVYAISLNVVLLWKLTRKLPPLEMKLKNVSGVTKAPGTGFSKRRLRACDTSIAILVDPRGQVLDGRHRVIKLRRERGEYILAKIVPWNVICKAMIPVE